MPTLARPEPLGDVEICRILPANDEKYADEIIIDCNDLYFKFDRRLNDLLSDVLNTSISIDFDRVKKYIDENMKICRSFQYEYDINSDSLQTKQKFLNFLRDTCSK